MVKEYLLKLVFVFRPEGDEEEDDDEKKDMNFNDINKVSGSKVKRILEII